MIKANQEALTRLKMSWIGIDGRAGNGVGRNRNWMRRNERVEMKKPEIKDFSDRRPISNFASQVLSETFFRWLPRATFFRTI